LSNPHIKKETLWTLSNMTAGNERQIQSVIDSGVIPTVILCLRAIEPEVRKEACWVIGNGVKLGTPSQIDYFVSKGCVKPLLDLLIETDFRIVDITLEALKNILIAGKLFQSSRKRKNPDVQEDSFEIQPKQYKTELNEITSVEINDKEIKIVDQDEHKVLNQLTEESFVSQEILDQLCNNNPYLIILKKLSAEEFLKPLLSHRNDEIARTSQEILENFFDFNIPTLEQYN